MAGGDFGQPVKSAAGGPVEDDVEVGSAQPPEESVAADPAWRLTALLLPIGAGLSAVLTLGQVMTGSLSGATGYVAALLLAVLCIAFIRDARRRSRSGRWISSEVHEFALPLGLLLVALALLAHGADLFASAPALLVLLPVAWEIMHVPRLERIIHLLPRALPVLNGPAAAPVTAAGEDEIKQMVRDVLDGLPEEIATRLEGWTVEVRDAAEASPPGTVIFGQCFYVGHVIAIYSRPHLLYHGRGDALRSAVAYTVLHEIAHALGLDETGVRRLGWLADTTP